MTERAQWSSGIFSSFLVLEQTTSSAVVILNCDARDADDRVPDLCRVEDEQGVHGGGDGGDAALDDRDDGFVATAEQEKWVMELMDSKAVGPSIVFFSFSHEGTLGSIMERADRVLACLETSTKKFLYTSLPQSRYVTLVDKWGNEYKTTYLLERHGLSAGWSDSEIAVKKALCYPRPSFCTNIIVRASFVECRLTKGPLHIPMLTSKGKIKRFYFRRFGS
ncbi:nudix hydrolase homolog 15 [Striga asiatica]|uniref:Nudix hydrolase homolog 15 n=1 Tax=Striga asiatica TaxID=4170 RepID=A0A5A7R261_STRAF|nr:nudix hydrolase homolog 15 [Striga asiatica]